MSGRSIPAEGMTCQLPYSDDLRPYFSRHSELSLYDGCVLWGNSVVIPMMYKQAVLTQLHDSRPGMAKMKAMSRMYVWWPEILSEIEA